MTLPRTRAPHGAIQIQNPRQAKAPDPTPDPTPTPAPGSSWPELVKRPFAMPSGLFASKPTRVGTSWGTVYADVPMDLALAAEYLAGDSMLSARLFLDAITLAQPEEFHVKAE